ncbi:Uncharacterised protein [Bordetella pertussis]|nr:Uncharacterised protein [Bordetella pertussis]
MTMPMRPCSSASWYISRHSPSTASESRPISTGPSNCSTATRKISPAWLPT